MNEEVKERTRFADVMVLLLGVLLGCLGTVGVYHTTSPVTEISPEIDPYDATKFNLDICASDLRHCDKSFETMTAANKKCNAELEILMELAVPHVHKSMANAK